MVNLLKYLEGIWTNWDKIYLAHPENLPFLFIGFPFLCLFFMLVWYSRTRNRLNKTHASRYSRFMDMKMWFGMILVYGLTSFALAKPMMAKSTFETSLGPVEVTFNVDLSLSAHLKYFGESGLTSLDIAKTQIQLIEPSLTSIDQASIFYFAKSAHEAFPMFPLDESLRQLFIKAVDDIRLPKKLNTITTYNPTLNFVDSSNIVSILQENYKLYDKTQKFKNPDYRPGVGKNRIIFLLSDGDYALDPIGDESVEEAEELVDYRKSMLAALGELKKRGMRIYAIGIGSKSGVPLINALKKYKKGSAEEVDSDFSPEYEEAIIKQGLSRVYPATLQMLVRETGGNPSTDVFLIDRPGINAYEFMHRIIDSHRQKNEARTVESRDDEPVWKSVVVAAIGLTALSLVGWRIFTVCLLTFYFFGGFIISHIPIAPLIERIISIITKGLA